jgi:chromosomal replication initiation ATPase DnaA
MTLSDTDKTNLRELLSRETTMIGGLRHWAKGMIEKIDNGNHAEQIVKRVADQMGVTVSHIKGRSQLRKAVDARMVAAYYLAEEGFNNGEIAYILGGRNRTSINHYRHQWETAHIGKLIKLVK